MLLLADQFVWTAQDEYERLLVTQELTNVGRQRQLARTAILNVLREMPNRARWSYYDRRYTLRTVASQTGTCTYDHTGGASERLITLASATLPTDGTGEFYRVVIDEVHYGIQRVLTSTTAMLDVNNNPGADVAALTECKVYRAYYPFPVGFRKLAHVWDTDQEREMIVLAEDELHGQSISIFSDPGTPEYVAIVNHGEVLSSLALVFSPPPDAARTFDILYEAAPQAISTWLYESGKVTTSTVTATLSDGGVTNANMVGSVIRFSGNVAKAPTSLVGGMDGTDNPFVAQRLVIAVPSSATLTMHASVDTYTAHKYTISDPIDIENGAMLLAFQKLCDAEYAGLLNLELKKLEIRISEAARCLRLAMENDQRATYARRTSPMFDKFRKPTVTTE